MYDPNLAKRLDALLPQTQCQRCGFAGCRPYANAIASDEADINRCPPGGPDTIAALARVLGRAAKPLDTQCGEHTPSLRALIDEDLCIGCTKCIQACPVDAILGAAKQMHTVIADECTGCELCVPPCPVDCIAMHPVGADALPTTNSAFRLKADRARQRYEFRNLRLARDRAEDAVRHLGESRQPTLEKRKAAIQAAVARVKAKRAAHFTSG